MRKFGDGDASYQAAGQREGIATLVAAFYDYMCTLPEAISIRDMHAEDLDILHDKLTVFLCGWLGGPKEYASKFGKMTIPRVHAHLAIDEPERDAWMLCMERAVRDQEEWSEEFKSYFLDAIAVPAERVRVASVAARHERGG